MLTRTFCHIPGVGAQTEKAVWSAGVHSWDSVLAAAGGKPAPPAKRSWLPHLQESRQRHVQQDVAYFASRIPSAQHWRLFHDFRRSCAFVDIETTGLSPWHHEITTIVLYDGTAIRPFISGENLGDFPKAVRDYRLLVSYNGKSFDVPFIERYFRIKLHQAHIDLRHVLRGLGIAGGQKKCEQRLGIRRSQSAAMDGFLAVLLWHAYRKSKERRFLESLLAYNVEDAVNLEALMVHAFNLNLKLTPFGGLALVLPEPPASPFRVDAGAVAQLTRRLY